MNKQKFLSELRSMLTFMTERDRDAAVAEYEAMLDAAEDEQALLKSLGTPLRVAVQLSRGYERPEGEEMWEEQELVSLDVPGTPQRPVHLTAERAAGHRVRRKRPVKPPKPADPDAGKQFRLRPAALIVYLLGCLVIGLPVAVLLAVVFLAVAGCGAGVIAAGVVVLKVSLWGLAVIADLMLLWGSALLLFAVGLLLLWLGIWLLAEALGGYIRWVVRTGRRFCRKEVVPVVQEVAEYE